MGLNLLELSHPIVPSALSDYKDFAFPLCNPPPATEDVQTDAKHPLNMSFTMGSKLMDSDSMNSEVFPGLQFQ